MADIEKTAMAFAREVLDWEDASFGKWEDKKAIVHHGLNAIDGKPETKMFASSSIEQVLSMVGDWCDRHKGLGFILRRTEGGKFTATIHDETHQPPMILSGKEAMFKDPCHALLLACVTASRKLREGK